MLPSTSEANNTLQSRLLLACNHPSNLRPHFALTRTFHFASEPETCPALPGAFSKYAHGVAKLCSGYVTFCRSMSGTITAGILPAAAFMNGHTAFAQQLVTGMKLDPFAVHASWVPGAEMKRFHFREEGMWMVCFAPICTRF